MGVRVVGLGHQVSQWSAGFGFIDKGFEAVRQADFVFICEATDLLGVLVQRLAWVVEVGFQVGSGGEEDHFYSARLRGGNHFAPGGFGPGQADSTVVQRVVDSDEVGMEREDVVVETGGAGFGVFAADRRDDYVDDGVGVALAEGTMEQGGVGFEGVDGRGFEIAGRDAVTVTDNVDGAVSGPGFGEVGFQTGEIGGLRGGARERFWAGRFG